jgi:hypothetical protein
MPGKNKIFLHIKISSPAYAWEKKISSPAYAWEK